MIRKEELGSEELSTSLQGSLQTNKGLTNVTWIYCNITNAKAQRKEWEE